MIIRALIFLLAVLVLSSCKDEVIDTTSQNVLTFSTDTLTFDTVFQTLGSATRNFRIYNKSSKTIIISKVELNRGVNSSFRYNIDGVPSSNNISIQVLPNDSVWVFVDVKIDPTTSSFIESDSLIITSNNGKQNVILRAFGQDCYLHKGEFLTSSTTWTADKPHVIIDETTSSGTVPGVIVSYGATLNIDPNAKLYFSNNSGILVRGTLKCNGTKEEPILMRGLRLEQPYIHLAGQWLGVLIERNSLQNVIEHTIIDESAFGVWAGFQPEVDFNKMTDATRCFVDIKSSTISNAYYWAIRSMNNNIKATNCVFFTSTDYLIQLFLGGEYLFENCTIYNSQSKDDNGNIFLSNEFYDEASKNTYKNPLTSALFQNCITYTNASESIYINLNTSINAESDYSFQNCLYSSRDNFSTSSFQDCILNQDPKFKDVTIDKEDFHLNAGSPCIDKGTATSLSVDKDDNPRQSGSAVDIGAYEFQ